MRRQILVAAMAAIAGWTFVPTEASALVTDIIAAQALIMDATQHSQWPAANHRFSITVNR